MRKSPSLTSSSEREFQRSTRRRPLGVIVALLALTALACGDDSGAVDGAMPIPDAAGDGSRLDGAEPDAPRMDGSTDAPVADSMQDGATGDAECSDCRLVLDRLKAFPSAMGAGSITTGGRGGRVVHVTNLDNSGAGSLREALMLEGPRTIVFDVSGRIHLSSRLELIDVNSDFTIAGETAPEGGITISGKPLLLAGGYDRRTAPTDNVIIRHVRFRNGSYTGVPDVYDHNGIISGGTDRFVFDHLSFSFNDDQAISMLSNYGPLQDGTIQRCLFSENATGIILGLERDFAAHRISVLRNAFIHQTHRTPNIGDDGRYDVINNVLFNWKARLTNVNGGSTELNYIGNHLSVGEHQLNANSNNKVQLGGAAVEPRIYTGDNYHSDRAPEPGPNDRAIWSDFSSSEPVAERYFVGAAYELLPETVVLSAAEARDDVLADVGTSAFVSDEGTLGRYLDSYDEQRLSDIASSTSRDPSNQSWTQPELPNNRRPGAFYSTLPNIPEFFVVAHGITSESEVIDVYDFGAYQVVNDAGYSAFEMYLFFAAGDLQP